MSSAKLNLLALLLSGAFLWSATSQAAVSSKAYGESYSRVSDVGADQAQIVYYRTSSSDSQAAHVYVDGEYHAALLSDAYTAFCVKAGSHSIASYIGDAPAYAGKADTTHRLQLEGGKTYFMKAGDGMIGLPVMVSRNEAEQELNQTRQQKHTLSRASAVQACNYRSGYTLPADVLFAFGKSSRNDLTPEGRLAVSEMVKNIRSDNSEPQEIVITGHTDALGTQEANQSLGHRRALTVRNIMMEEGLPASTMRVRSAGASEPVVTSCVGSRQEKIACMAPNRRVTVSVDGSGG